MAPPLINDRIIVGIDFGTTFSGAAFTYSVNPDTPDEISTVKNWPGGNNITSDKVPSELAYAGQKSNITPSFGVKRNALGSAVGNPSNNNTSSPNTRDSIVWGYELKPEDARLRYLKLLLDPRQELPSYVSREDLCRQLLQYGKTPSEAVADYLSALHEQIQEALLRRYGEQMVSTTQIDYMLTVPAVWSDAAKDATLRAAEKAGIGPNLHMISEPEAAAIYALKSMELKMFNVGDNFIVCDAGGGTVDLISYEVRSTTPLRLEESVPGTGALCGGAFLNLRFQDLVKTRLGEDTFKAYVQKKPKAWAVAQNYFETYVKRKFDPSDSQDDYDDSKFNVILPGVEDNPAAGIADDFIILSTADVAELFRPLVNKVIELVERQRILLAAYDKVPQGVILVGGFGQSNYLYRSLKSRFADDDPPPPYFVAESTPCVDSNIPRFVVLQPTNAWTAVVRGAVLSGLEGDKLVSSRKARHHYGVRCRKAFNPRIHSQKNKKWCSLTETFGAANQISWHIKKGQTLVSGKPVILNFIAKRANDEEKTHSDWELVVSDEKEAPQEFVASQQTRVLCKLVADLRQVPRSRWETRYTSTRKMYSKLELQIGMEVESGGLLFNAMVGGKVNGTVRADFE